ncbi:hypothetical protein [Gordonia cholesterolivorans]|uniref:Uncharacterized protein n=1 Tax=Gordonia cholesterolivorans TaxID=559625 RepID=A0ABN3HDY3_9ACTN
MRNPAAVDELAEASNINDAYLEVIESRMERRTDPNAEESESIEAQGRIDIELGDKPVVAILIKLGHKTARVDGEITAVLRYVWEDSIEVDEDALVEFARRHGVATALPATAALFSEEFRRFGVKVPIPPPLIIPRIADALADGYVKRS